VFSFSFAAVVTAEISRPLFDDEYNAIYSSYRIYREQIDTSVENFVKWPIRCYFFLRAFEFFLRLRLSAQGSAFLNIKLF
jgi:hypothetical protein